jgi:sulfatase maturation enzyme AslB (radical SAM superfamily)
MNNSDILCQIPEECDTCPLFKICSGGCISVNKDLYNDINCANPTVCMERKYYYKLAMSMMLLLNNNETFFYYLDEISSHFLPKD